jgi:hypothetical protein
MKKLIKKIIGDKIIGIIDYFRYPESQIAWVGPFNNQKYRQRIFEEILEKCNISAIFETGTYHGTTTEYMARKSGLPVYTVELVSRNYGFCLVKFLGQSQIKMSLGDSRSFLRSYFKLSKFKNVFVFIYLDSHWYEDLPLLDELEIVFSNKIKAIIMIDDFEVPGDTGYAFDDYGPEKRLTMSYLSSLDKYYYSAFFPKCKSEDESGLKRGCIVISTSPELTSILNNVDSLNAYNESMVKKR